MTTGSVHLNGITDKQLVAVLECKIRHENLITFNPQAIQQVRLQQVASAPIVNNNVIVAWNTEAGCRAVLELLAELTSHRIVAKEAA